MVSDSHDHAHPRRPGQAGHLSGPPQGRASASGMNESNTKAAALNGRISPTAQASLGQGQSQQPDYQDLLLQKCLATVPTELPLQAVQWLRQHTPHSQTSSQVGCEGPSQQLGRADHPAEIAANNPTPVSDAHRGSGVALAVPSPTGSSHSESDVKANCVPARPQGWAQRWSVALSVAAAVLVVVGGLAILSLQDTGSSSVGPSSVAQQEKSAQPASRPTNPAGQEPLDLPHEVVQAPEQSGIEDPAGAAPQRKPLSTSELLSAQLAAGEFGPALQTARSVKNLEVRSQYLAQVAQAQASAGLFGGAIDTIGQMADDDARTGALRGLRGQAVGAAGGGPRVDYDSLIDLIQNTVERDTWEAVGGPGTLRPYPQGVWVDAQGVLHRELNTETQGWLEQIRHAMAPPIRGSLGPQDVRAFSQLRKVSLPRLERLAQLKAAAGEPLPEEMFTLAGLQRIEYLFVYPDSGDLVIAGPAGDWTTDTAGRTVGTQTGHPTLRLDDLVTLLRYVRQHPGQPFGCSIDPRQENLAKAQQFIAAQQSAKRPIRTWVSELADQLGLQDIVMLGELDPQSNVARTLVEADYHMKLIAAGLVDGGHNVPSYLSALQPGQAGGAVPLLRCWFTLNYQSIQANQNLQAFEFSGSGVKVNTEDGLLAAQGQKNLSGQADERAQAFAHNFTAHFEELAKRYPVYGQLQGVFDLALACALIRSGSLDSHVDWSMSYFGPSGDYLPKQLPGPQAVKSVFNHKTVRQGRLKHTFAMISGGVSANPWTLARKDALEIENRGELSSVIDRSAPQELPAEQWWWD